MGLRRELFWISKSMSAVPSGGVITAQESWAELRPSRLGEAVQPPGQTDTGAWMWGEASHVHLSRDNSILRAPGTCKGHHQMLPPLSHLSGCSQNFRASTQLRTGGNSASRRLKHMETCSPLRGYKTFVIFSRDFLENHLNPLWVRGWSALHKQHITAHSKAAAPAGRWQNWSLGR